MARSGAAAGHLVSFDRSEARGWEEKLFNREAQYRNQVIKAWACKANNFRPHEPI